MSCKRKLTELKTASQEKHCPKSPFPNQHDMSQSDLFIDYLHVQSHTPLGLKPKLLPGFSK